MLKSSMAAALLLALFSANGAMAAQSEMLGAIWREGANEDKTVWIIGTLRLPEDLDALTAAEGQGAAAAASQKPLHASFLRFEAQCSEADFSIHVKANAFAQEPPVLDTISPYSFEDSPLREASVIVNGQSSLNLHYLWGQISGISAGGADDRRALTGSFYRLLTQIEDRSTSEIKIYTPKAPVSYMLDKAYQEAANKDAIAKFKQACGAFASNWH